MMKFSIVTICFNAAEEIKTTMESVLAQDFDDFEYIIEDGMSEDATEDIVKGYAEKFAARGIKFVYNRQPDKGIYDAMNKGVASATGDYVNFMNAGDCFYSVGVLTEVAQAMDKSEDIPDIVYGDCVVYEYGRFYMFRKAPDKIEETMPFSHQSVFAKTQLLRDHPFDIGYRYSADYDFLLTAHDIGAKFLDSGTVVCIATADGTSSINYHDTLMESAGILKAHGVLKQSPEELAKTERTLRLKQFVLDHFPVSVKRRIRNRQIISRGQDFTAVVPPWFERTTH